MKNKRISIKEKGITLVALVVTIIVLLILAGVTISLVVGQNGIINRAKFAYNIWTNTIEDENIIMGHIDRDMENLTAGYINNSNTSDLAKLTQYFVRKKPIL